MVLDIAIMLEGQAGLNWSRLARIAEVIEGSGYAGLYRSDHLIAHQGEPTDALELWASLTWLASHTRRIAFGPLVTPISLRDPVLTAFTAAAVDDLSGGRLQLGLGAGWQEREHTSFGYELQALGRRFDRFAEALEVIRRLLREPGPISFDGHYFRLRDATLLPRPARPGGPPITIGGKGERRTLPLVARFADEWNATSMSLADLQRRNTLLDDLLRANGRQPTAVRRSFMTTVIFGRDEAALRLQLAGRSAADLVAAGRIVGTPSAIVDQLAAWAAAGLDRVMLRWENLDDTDGLREMAEALLPHLTTS